MSKLDELNAELKKLNLPKHRNTVDNHGSNLKWLRKHIAKNKDTPQQVKDLLDLQIGELVNS